MRVPARAFVMYNFLFKKIFFNQLRNKPQHKTRVIPLGDANDIGCDTTRVTARVEPNDKAY